MRVRVRRAPAGVAVALGVMAALSAAMVPVRSHMSVATSALVLVVPVVAGVVVGGFLAGVVAVVAGFLVYDVLFIPPYGTLVVGRSQNWVALGVYAAVMLIVARAVAQLDEARAEARRREGHTRRLFELSDLLISERAGGDLFERVVQAVREAFGLASVVLLLRRGDTLEPVAQAGEPWDQADLDALVPRAGVPVAVGVRRPGVRAIALDATGSTVGLLGLRGRVLGSEDGEALRTFANQVALTVERARLREQVMAAEVLHETERVQKALIGAVSHDLRTPLASIKVAASTLRTPGLPIAEGDRAELLDTIDAEADRLGRLVTNLLDVSRVQAGMLTVRPQPVAVVDLVRDALEGLRPLLGRRSVSVELVDGLPLVEVDHVLVSQALVNLIDNAARHSPDEGAVEVAASLGPDDLVVLSVRDRGPGVPAAERERVFELFYRTGPGEGSGVGLAIAKAFVEAHGQRIWVDDAEGGGAAFHFTLPAVALDVEHG